MAKIKAVIFDVDGTIVDSRELIYTAFEDVLGSRGIHLTRPEIAIVTGKPVQAMYGILAPNHDVVQMEIEHLQHHEENVELLGAYPGIVEMLEALKASGLTLGLFTGFNQLVHDRLAKVGLSESLFGSIIDNTMYTAHKPDPEGLLECMNQLGVTNPDEVVYVGDGIADMGAGKNAKVALTIGVTHGFTAADDLKNAGADVVFDSLDALPKFIQELK